jgi:hypothetical protein
VVRRSHVTRKRTEAKEKEMGSLTWFNWLLIELDGVLFSLFVLLLFYTKFYFSPPFPQHHPLIALTLSSEEPPGNSLLLPPS